LRFKVDKGVAHSLEVGEILAKIQREKEAGNEESAINLDVDDTAENASSESTEVDSESVPEN
jgi:hypothetical protein